MRRQPGFRPSCVSANPRRRGPAFDRQATTMGRSGIIFRIEVRTSDGQTQTGWLRLGYDFFARQPWSEKVVWDDEPAA
jgi:hypothetical protein